MTNSHDSDRNNRPTDSSHDELLARAFRDNRPQPKPQEDPGEDQSGLLAPTVGELDLAERNAFRRVCMSYA